MKGSPPQIRFSVFRLLAASVLSLGIVLCGPAPFVASVAAQSRADIEKAKKQFHAGKKYYDDGKFLEAAQAFEKAYELSKRSELLYNIGHSYWKAKKLKKAETYLQKYLNALPDAPNADQVVESIIQIQEDMAAQMANIKVDATRTGVEIYVDKEDSARCKTPCTLSLLPGKHTLTARPAGMAATTKTITVKAEQKSSVKFALPGRLQVQTDQRSGTVKIDGASTVSLPMTQPVSLAPGKHKLTVIGADGNHWKGSVDVTSGELTHIMVPMAPLAESGGHASMLRTVSYGLAGASAGFLIGGIVLGMHASDTHSALQDRQNALGSVDPKMVDQGKSAQFGANLMYTLSAVSLAGGAGLFAWDLYGGGSKEQDIPASKPAAPAKQAKDDGGLLQVGHKGAAAKSSDANSDGSAKDDGKGKAQGDDLF